MSAWFSKVLCYYEEYLILILIYARRNKEFLATLNSVSKNVVPHLSKFICIHLLKTVPEI